MQLPRVYPILDTGALLARGIAPADFAQAVLDGGASILQFRHKGSMTRASLTQLEAVARRCANSGAMLVVNDRADIAAIFDAGLHLGQDDLPVALARKVLGGRRVLGYSTHTPEQLLEADAQATDYLAIGPVFGTRSKERLDPVVGLEGVRLARSLTKKPLVAIGGITLETAREVLEAGADSIAVIAGMLPEDANPRTISQRMVQWQQVTR